MRVVITGARGNVGTSVVEALRHDAEVSSIVGLLHSTPRQAADSGFASRSPGVGRRGLTPPSPTKERE